MLKKYCEHADKKDYVKGCDRKRDFGDKLESKKSIEKAQTSLQFYGIIRIKAGKSVEDVEKILNNFLDNVETPRIPRGRKPKVKTESTTTRVRKPKVK